MYTILLAGAGQLGSRHLQGIKKSKHELNIWVYDLSQESLAVAEERYNQLPEDSLKTIHFVQSLEIVPLDIDVVINATGSMPRSKIIKDILTHKNVRYMILEKFLFGDFKSYDEIGELIKAKEVKTWVNCPFRLYKGYQKLKEFISFSAPLEFNYSGSSWGLCCNSIHYIDIFMYLTNSTEYSLDIKGLDNNLIESKRPGYVELLGTIVVKNKRGDKLVLTSLPNSNILPFAKIYNNGNNGIINENNNTISFGTHLFPLGLEYQSNLTGVLLDEILETGSCKLSTYDDSAKYHMIFLSKIAPFINLLMHSENTICPIT